MNLEMKQNVEELKQSLWLTTMELKARDDRLTQLEHLLNDAVYQRNQIQNNYQSLLLLQHQLHHRRRQTTSAPPYSGVSCVEDEPITNFGFCSSDCEESIESPVNFPAPAPEGWPENGKFLEAVKNVGPLLQNLLMAGPLPNWRQPPPAIDTCQIPSPAWVVPTQCQIPSPAWVVPTQHINISSNSCEFNKKRVFCEDSISSTETKIQRI
ncbi:uncharacterized protein LOC143562964 [Bidens hawaiensis]|uniref:uncharacterized protein LOC143562964 n=1 Tax=Bidens hawaiensis TaxID=980011 RepID=UPI00404B3D69